MSYLREKNGALLKGRSGDLITCCCHKCLAAILTVHFRHERISGSGHVYLQTTSISTCFAGACASGPADSSMVAASYEDPVCLPGSLRVYRTQGSGTSWGYTMHWANIRRAGKCRMERIHRISESSGTATYRETFTVGWGSLENVKDIVCDYYVRNPSATETGWVYGGTVAKSDGYNTGFEFSREAASVSTRFDITIT